MLPPCCPLRALGQCSGMTPERSQGRGREFKTRIRSKQPAHATVTPANDSHAFALFPCKHWGVGLPEGTVTFLFTDIEGSTALLHEHGDGYAEILSEHRRMLRSAF